MNIGYITIEFNQEFKDQLKKWSLANIPDSEIVEAEISGKKEGGNVSADAHLTLFYGFDDDNINREKLHEYINSLNLQELQIAGIGFFPVPQYSCKVLYLKVLDEDRKLENIYNFLKRFPHFKKFQIEGFAPHVTIAYIKDGYKPPEFLSTMKKIQVREIKYQIKSKK